MRRIILYTGTLFVVFNFLFYSLIAYYNRYQTDDLAFTAKINEFGLYGALKEFFLNWEANLTSIVLFLSLDFFQNKNLLFLNGTIFLSNIFSLWFLIRRLATVYKIRLNDSELLLTSAFFVVMLYNSVRAGGGVIYWATAQIAYFIPLNFLFLGCGFWIFGKKNNSIATASFFMFLFAHSRINYDVSFAALYFSIVFLFFYKYKKIDFLSHLPFIFFILGIVSYFLVPGVYKRIAFHQNLSEIVSKPNNSLYYIKNILIGIFHFYKMAIINVSFWFVFLISFLFGSLFNEDLPNLISSFQFKKLGVFLFLFNIALLMHVLIILLALKTPIGYGRVFVFVELLWLVVLMLVGIILGTRFRFPNFSKFASMLVIFLFLFFLIKNNINSLRQAKVFAKQFDDRIAYLEKLKLERNRTKIYIPSLEGTDVFGYEDIQHEDTVRHIHPYPNYSIQQFYRLPFQVFLKN